MPASSSEEIVQNARALEQKGAPSDIIHKYVSMATQELNALNDRQTNIAGLDKGAQAAGNAINTATLGLGAPIVDTTRRVIGAGLKAGASLAGPVAQAAKSAVTNPLDLISGGISKPITDATKSATNAYVAADKRFPTENLLPLGAAAAGDYYGTQAGLAVKHPLIGGSIGAGLATVPADLARQYISGARGNAPMPDSFASALKDAGAAGEKMAGNTLLIGGALKGLQTIASTPMAKKGFQKFSDLVIDRLKPVAYKVYEKVLDKIGDIPVGNVSDIKDFLKNWLEKRGITQDTGAGGLSPIQQENFAEAVKSGKMTQKDVELFTQQAGGKGLTGEVRKIGRKLTDPLQSELKTPPLSDYKKFGDVLHDLSLSELTYRRLKQVQTAAGDLAKFGSSDRGFKEKMMGTLYKKLGDRLGEAADNAGVLKDHTFLRDEGSKFYQKQLLENTLGGARTFGEKAPQLSYKKVATDLAGYTDDELSMLFGDSAKYIKTIRDMAASHAASFPSAPQVYGAVGATGNPVFRLRPGATLFRHPNVPDYVDAIMQRNLGAEGSTLKRTALPNMLFPQEQAVARAPFKMLSGPPIPINEKKRK